MASLPILTYHRLLDEEPTRQADPRRIAVSARQFRAQLAWLKRLGYRTLRLDDYAEMLRAGQEPPARSFAISFDDGYEEVLRLGLPILQAFGYTATVFAVAGELGGVNRWDGGTAALLSADQYRTLERAGIAIGGHTLTHVHLPEASLERVRQELVESKGLLEEVLGKPVTTFAYPYGESTEAVEREVEAAGYRAAYATDRAPADHRANRYRLRRAVVFPRNSVWEILWKAQPWYSRYQDWKRR
jgi:peptidoglycan/xylan/chitin deacetylase (PgdA/CDA1 family)